ncbi:MAG: glycosyl hydrolase family 17 protein [Cytophagales bacterium]|nr:glycosyl hydrolase family 17 protein [Cytophagales bacterium]
MILPYEKAICYSGFRDGQSPDAGIFPTYEEIKEDLLILEKHWKYVRLYDTDRQAEMALEIIQKEGLDLKIQLGAYIGAEVNNFNCPWGGVHSEDTLISNKQFNVRRIKKLIRLANEYPEIINSLSVGNEATVDWTDHMVPVESVVNYVKMVKAETKQPVTFCENYVPWLTKLEPLAEVVDFISIHTYPVWEYKNIHEAIHYTEDNYKVVAEKYPHKQIVITEAGWATNSNGRGIDPENVSEEFQDMYYQDLMEWCDENQVVCYVFEAFDENWKGSPEPNEPEKHWGLFYIDRTPKKVMDGVFSELV